MSESTGTVHAKILVRQNCDVYKLNLDPTLHFLPEPVLRSRHFFGRLRLRNTGQYPLNLHPFVIGFDSLAGFDPYWVNSST